MILNWIDLTDRNNGNSLALFTDHTTSYSYGKEYPLGLTIQYSGKGLWGRDYTITEPLRVKYALLPHKETWDRASVSSKSASWNEPLITYLSSHLSFKNKSFIDLQNSGYELSSVQTMNDGVLVRIYNAEGDEGIRKIKLGFPYKSIQEIELNGETRQTDVSIKANSTDEFWLSIPRFGVRTFHIRN